MTSLSRRPVASATTWAQAQVVGISRVGYQPLICTLALIGADVAAIYVAVVLAWSGMELVWGGPSSFPPPDGALARRGLLVVFAAIVVYLAVKERYRERIPFWTETRLVVCATLCAVGAVAVLGLLAERILAFASVLAALLVFPPVATAANRFAKYVLSLAGMWTLPVVVVGDGPSAMAAEAALASDRSLGYRFVGRLDPAALMAGRTTPRLRPLLNRYHARRLLIALDVDGDLQRQVIDCALRERVPFAVVPQPCAFPAFACDLTRVFSHEAMLLSFRGGLSRPMARFNKAAFDIVVAAFLLAFTSPLFLILAILSRLDGGPALFKHRRVGAGGRPFHCLKFRTMVGDADRVLEDALARDPALAAEWAATRKLVNDPRITRVGRLLRCASLDELPQLINVLRLEMSLVGPRPIVESEVPLYGEDIAQYYATRPGLTGLWQVSGRSNTSYARRVQLDVWYVNNWTVWHDIAVLLKTIPVVFRRQGAR